MGEGVFWHKFDENTWQTWQVEKISVAGPSQVWWEGIRKPGMTKEPGVTL